ncbi:MAG: 3-deoxy-D-manno-octulosonic acid kinase [Lysobacterales bacterium]
MSNSAAPVEWFDPGYWVARNQQVDSASGRGKVSVVRHDDERWVLRHYQRGGMIGRVIHDRYLFAGHQRVRAVREFELLRLLVDWGLPTCVPVAARYQRQGPMYQADLITRFVPHEQTLAQWLGSDSFTVESLDATFRQVGEVVGRFQVAGIHHADLNCHNILLSGDTVSIIDFDRGTVVPPGAWQQATLKRLRRSVLKVSNPLRHREIAAAWTSLVDMESSIRAGIDVDELKRSAPSPAVSRRSAPGR